MVLSPAPDENYKEFEDEVQDALGQGTNKSNLMISCHKGGETSPGDIIFFADHTARSEVPDEPRGKLPSTLLQLLMLVLGAQLKTMSCSVLGILKLCIHPATYNIVGDAGLYILACRHTWAKGLLYLLRAADVRRLFPHAKTMQRGQSISFPMSHTLLDKPKPGFWSATRPTTPQLLVQQGIFHMDEVPGIILELMKNPAMRTTWKRAMQPCFTSCLALLPSVPIARALLASLDTIDLCDAEAAAKAAGVQLSKTDKRRLKMFHADHKSTMHLSQLGHGKWEVRHFQRGCDAADCVITFLWNGQAYNMQLKGATIVEEAGGRVGNTPPKLQDASLTFHCQRTDRSGPVDRPISYLAGSVDMVILDVTYDADLGVTAPPSPTTYFIPCAFLQRHGFMLTPAESAGFTWRTPLSLQPTAKRGNALVRVGKLDLLREGIISSGSALNPLVWSGTRTEPRLPLTTAPIARQLLSYGIPDSAWVTDPQQALLALMSRLNGWEASQQLDFCLEGAGITDALRSKGVLGLAELLGYITMQHHMQGVKQSQQLRLDLLNALKAHLQRSMAATTPLKALQAPDQSS